ncbi:hypothetical protein BC332_06504 [Capsicum chinense]|nr:hypothetical protein BC332_06504 [Capsicum chinense]
MWKANGKKQLSTKFRQHRKERMFESAKRVGWKLQNPTVDILPECLIQEILGFLSYDEATKTSILFKTWLQAWSTLSNLKFTADFYKVNMDLVDNIMERYRDENIPIEKFELSKSYSSCSPRIVPMFYRWLDVAL